MIKLYKLLTRNDTGETHSHQSGITIPKSVAETPVFPRMSTKLLNPRVELVFFDERGNMWTFQYIYYNDVFFGKPKNKSHNEHRLTCVTSFIRENRIKAGDSIWFSIDDAGVRKIGFKRSDESPDKKEKTTMIVLSQKWKCIKY